MDKSKVKTQENGSGSQEEYADNDRLIVNNNQLRLGSTE